MSPTDYTTTRVCATCSCTFSLIPGQPVWLDGTVCAVECIPYTGKYPPEYIERYTRKQRSSVPLPLPPRRPRKVAQDRVDKKALPYRVSLFWSKVDIRGDDACWLWTAGKTGMGYGVFMYEDKQWYVHRLAWVLTNGPIHDGLFVCHNCPENDTPLCCNPSHMFLGTHEENIQDMWVKRRVKIEKGIPVNKIGRPRKG